MLDINQSLSETAMQKPSDFQLIHRKNIVKFSVLLKWRFVFQSIRKAHIVKTLLIDIVKYTFLIQNGKYVFFLVT